MMLKPTPALHTLKAVAADLIQAAPAGLDRASPADPWPMIVALRETARSLSAVADVMAAVARQADVRIR